MSELMQVDREEHFNRMSDSVRMFCTEKCNELLRALTPYVNGDFGDIEVGHVAAYMNALKELAKLWQASSRPVFSQQVEVGIPAQQVELMIESAVTHAVDQAVAEALEQERVRMKELTALSTDEARDRVRMQLLGR